MSPFRSRLTLQSLEDRTVPDATPVYLGPYSPPALTSDPPAAPGSPPGTTTDFANVPSAPDPEVVAALQADNVLKNLQIAANTVLIGLLDGALPAAETAVDTAQAAVNAAQADYDKWVKIEAEIQKEYDASVNDPPAARAVLLQRVADAKEETEFLRKVLAEKKADLAAATAQVKALKDSIKTLEADNKVLRDGINANNEAIKKYSPAPNGVYPMTGGAQ